MLSCWCWPLRNFNLIFIIIFIKISCSTSSIPTVDIQKEPCEPEKFKSSPANSAYEEFVLEHEVTKYQAIEAIRQLNDTFYNAPKSPGCKPIVCSPKVMKYCLGSQFLNDHCWCEQGHGKEGLPWVPHTCYVGDNNDAFHSVDCFFYTDVKECCCDRALAKRWRFLSASSRTSVENLICIFASIAVSKLLHLVVH